MQIIIAKTQRKGIYLPYGFKKKLKILFNEITKDMNIPCKKVFAIFTSGSYMKRLNYISTKRDRDTDVLAYSLGNHCEIYISVDTARKNALAYHTTYIEELGLYLIHALLHLSGYDHKIEKYVKLMESKQAFYLKRWKTIYSS